jgi:hypothetical protein
LHFRLTPPLNRADGFKDYSVFLNHRSVIIGESGWRATESGGPLEPDFADDLAQAGVGPFESEEGNLVPVLPTDGQGIRAAAIIPGGIAFLPVPLP